MSKKSSFRGPYEKELCKGNQTLLKHEPRSPYEIYWSLWWLLRGKKSLLVICKIFGLFVNSLASSHKYSELNRENLKKLIQMQLYQKQKLFSEPFSGILKSRLNFLHFQKKMTLIADIFQKLRKLINAVK